MRVLVVEDDYALGEGLFQAMRQDGYAVDWLTDGLRALQSLKAEHFDLVILDLGLPKRDGLNVLRDIRRAGEGVPVIILTARDAVADRVQGLDAGADDYLTKPFDLGELSARVRALIRRSQGLSSPEITAGDLRMDPAVRKVTLRGDVVELSPKEFSLLRAMMLRADRVIPRYALQESAYAWGQEIESNALEVHVHNLRKKLGKERIRTVRGVGYELASD
jgi:DNA-binding response OmpR family regulator